MINSTNINQQDYHHVDITHHDLEFLTIYFKNHHYLKVLAMMVHLGALYIFNFGNLD